MPSVPNPLADLPGQPPLVPPQPSLSLKGRTPESLRRAIIGRHRELAEGRSAATAVRVLGSVGLFYRSPMRRAWTGEERRVGTR